jgi:hypothetical protein
LTRILHGKDADSSANPSGVSESKKWCPEVPLAISILCVKPMKDVQGVMIQHHAEQGAWASHNLSEVATKIHI